MSSIQLPSERIYRDISILFWLFIWFHSSPTFAFFSFRPVPIYQWRNVYTFWTTSLSQGFILNYFLLVFGQLFLKCSLFSLRSSRAVFPHRFDFLLIFTIYMCNLWFWDNNCFTIFTIYMYNLWLFSNCFAQIGNKTECALLGFVMDLGVDYQKVGTLFYYCRRHHQKDPKSLSTSSSARPDLGKLLPFVESAQRNFLFVQIIRYIPAHLSRKHFLNIFLKRRPNSHFKILSYKCAWKAGFR